MFAPAEFLDLEHTAHPKLFENQNYVWDALKQIASYLQFRLKPAVLGELMGKPFISNSVFVGAGTIVEQGAMLKGPALVGGKRHHPRGRHISPLPTRPFFIPPPSTTKPKRTRLTPPPHP